ncbi:MAG: flagellar hook-basal body complex protein FliE, partial [Limnochordia bacterium]
EQAGLLLAKGEIDVHNAVIMAEKANLALQLTIAIRNKIIEAYQEIMRMQV